MKRRTGANLADSTYDCTNVGMCSLHSLLFLQALRKPGLTVGMYVQTEWRESRKTRAASGPKTFPGHAIVDKFAIRENNRLVDFKRRWDLRLNCSLNFRIFAIMIGGRSCRRHEFLSPTY